MTACSKPQSRIIAKVGDVSISEEEFKDEMRIQSQKYDLDTLSQPANMAQFKKNVLNLLIEEAILLNEANRLHISFDSETLNKIISASEVVFDSKNKDNTLEDNKTPKQNG